ncbi:dUTPase [Thiomicrorhabdus immobilis]|uniref:dUTPase n=1 Tax=Thiomicrorhabdus immobilis TaxID=2791037 RepID=A0ABN6CWW2_9GAMM|nr:dUTP diphosphatase [Thiomicrorhabdus immobilis]BCN93500.1 dUTPase [Thiomicrorhabdus immobilis]
MQNPQIVDSINEMLTMQNTLNEATNGVDWRSGVTVLGKPINWRRCIVMETAELIDSYPWKHWKAVDAKTDMENVRVELVDIWHFLQSLVLEHFELERAATILAQVLSSKGNPAQNTASLSVIEQVEVHEKMLATALEAGEVSEGYLERLTKAFVDSCSMADLSFTQLYQIYMAKNVLNQFRQDHGYKEGTYIKEWHGKEDNVVMFEIIAEMTDFSGDELYIRLKESYKNLPV